jgi:N-acetylglucosamine transport system permease protein
VTVAQLANPRRSGIHRGKTTFILSFLAVPLLLYAVFVLVPYFTAMLVSLTRWRGLSMNITFNGVNNFIKLFNDPRFWNALSHNFVALVVLPPVILGLALFFAFLFTQGIRGSRFFRITFFFPQVMSVVVVAVLWSFVFHPTLGILNAVIKAIGLQALVGFPWLGDPATVFPAILAVVVWQSVGFYMVLFVSGMAGIPNDYYEAARIDGANSWTLFWKVTLPLLWSTVQVGMVFIGIGAMDLFAIVNVMTNGLGGGPSHAADVVPTYLTESAFTHSEWGYATAMGVVLLFLILGLSALSMRLTRRENVEY